MLRKPLVCQNIKYFKGNIPNSFPSIMAGTVLAFARALGNLVTIMVAGNIPGKTQTVGSGLYCCSSVIDLDL